MDYDFGRNNRIFGGDVGLHVAKTMYILQQNQVNSNPAYEDFNLALKIVNDCSHSIKSYSVLNTVIQNLDLDLTYKQLSKSLKITNPPDTRFLEIEVESFSPESAKEIVDEICVVATEKITDTMGFEQVNFYEEGIFNPNPSNKTSTLMYIFVAFVAMVLTYLVFFLIYIFDDRLRTDEDIKSQLNLSILGDIPFVDDSKKNNDKIYRNKYYKRYDR